MAAGITAFQSVMGERAADGYVVHPGEISLPLAPRVRAVSFGDL
jgi:hypothetical protein